MTREELEGRVARIRQELAEASDGRYPAPRLIAVTKTHSPEEILPLAEAGVTEIGENAFDDTVTIICKDGSAAEAYCIRENIPYIDAH